MLYCYVLTVTSSGVTQNLYHTNYLLKYGLGTNSEAEIRSLRMHAKIKLANPRQYPIEDILQDRVEIQKINPEFWPMSLHLQSIPTCLAEHGYHKEAVQLFEQILAAISSIKDDTDTYNRFLKTLPPLHQSKYTLQRFQGDLRGARESAQEDYAIFLSTSRNNSVRNPKHAIEIVHQLQKQKITPARVRILANALAANGEFEKAREEISRAQKLYLDKYPVKSFPRSQGYVNSFLEGVNKEKIAFSEKKLVLSHRY